MKRSNALSKCFSLEHVTIDDAVTPNPHHAPIRLFKNPMMNLVKRIHEYVNSERNIVYTFKSLDKSGQCPHSSFGATSLKGPSSISNIFLSGGVRGYLVGDKFRRSTPKTSGRVFIYSPENDFYEIYTPFPMQIFGSERKHHPPLKTIYREEVESIIANNSVKRGTSEIIKRGYLQSKSRKGGI